MNIAYINLDSGVPAFGTKGASVHVQEMIRAFANRGAKVDLVTTRCGGEAPHDLAGTRVHELGISAASDVAARERAAINLNTRLRSELEHLAQVSGVGFVYERYSLWSFAALEFARERGIPSVLEVNAPLIEEQARHRALVDRAAAEEITARAFSAAATITTVSNQLAQIIERHPAARGKVRVIPNAINPQRFPVKPEAASRSDDEFVIGFLGTLKPWHGVETLAKAFVAVAPELPGARLLVVGDGPERARLEHELARANLSVRAQFTGAVEPGEVPRLLSRMEVAVAPYPPLEEFYFSPLKIFEYMAAGLPVIASRIGQVQDVLVHGETGWLVTPGDDRELAAALREMAADAVLRRSLGAAARREVLAKYTWDSVAGRVLAWSGAAEIATR